MKNPSPLKPIPPSMREETMTPDHSILKDRADELNHEDMLRKLAEEEAAKRRASTD